MLHRKKGMIIMWTYEEVENLIPNCTVRRAYKDGVHKNNRLIAHEGYAMHYIYDEGYTDEETGYYFPPSYSYQVILGIGADIYEYEAVPITDDMEVYR